MGRAEQTNALVVGCRFGGGAVPVGSLALVACSGGTSRRGAKAFVVDECGESAATTS